MPEQLTTAIFNLGRVVANVGQALGGAPVLPRRASCTAIPTASVTIVATVFPASFSSTTFALYSHDDRHYLPLWDARLRHDAAAVPGRAANGAAVPRRAPRGAVVLRCAGNRPVPHQLQMPRLHHLFTNGIFVGIN